MLMSAAFFSWQARTTVATCAFKSFFFMRSARLACNPFLLVGSAAIQMFLLDILGDGVGHQALQCAATVDRRPDPGGRDVLVGLGQHMQGGASEDQRSSHLLLAKQFCNRGRRA